MRKLITGILFLALYTQACMASPRIAILGPLQPLTDSGASKQIASILQNAHYEVSIITGEQLADENVLTPQNYDLLILPHSDIFPVNALPSLEKYLGDKGKLLCVGGLPFDHLVYDFDGRWGSKEALARDLSSMGSLDITRFPINDWSRSSGDPGTVSTVSKSTSPYGPSLRFHFSNFSQWDNFTLPEFDASPFPTGANAITLYAKGDSHTTGMTLEWREKDGSRWIAAVPLTNKWQKRLVLSTDFKFWRDGSPANRGGNGDYFHTENAAHFTIGIDQSHTPMPAGEKEFEIAKLEFVKAPISLLAAQPPVLESLSPWYKRVSENSENWLPILRYRGGSSVQPYGRLSSRTPTGWIYRSYSPPDSGSMWGYCRKPQFIRKYVDSILQPIYLGWAGPSMFSFLPGDPIRFIMHPINSGDTAKHIVCEVIAFRTKEDKHTEIKRRVTMNLPPNAGEDVTITMPRLSSGNWHYVANITDVASHALLDEIHNQFTVDVTADGPVNPITVHDGQFIFDGKPWHPAGVNYWPLWSSGQDANQYVAHWLSPNQYDPGLVERDMKRLQAIGVNEVCIMYLKTDQAPSLIDALYRCKEHGIHANVFIDGGNPLHSDPQKLISLIRAARLAHNPTVFAYDVAWEPVVGNHQEREFLDGKWAQWIKEQYRSVENAEKEWDYPVPMKNGVITNPEDNQITHNGPWRVMVCAYRRFIDDVISQGYLKVRQAIKSVDPFHLIGARSGYGGNGSIWAENRMPFDLVAGAKSLDFISPEGYALNGSWDNFLGAGGLTVAYARWAGNGKPVYWAEFGKSIYPGDEAANLIAQGDYYRLFYRMVLASKANGAACWWFPGGLRINENSDFGIFSPDGKPRPSALELKKFAQNVQDIAPPDQASLVDYTIDEDATSMGFPGIWENDQKPYLKLRLEGKFPVFVTAGTGKTTANMPLVSVGNIPADGKNPLKYANSEFNYVRTKHAGGLLALHVSIGNTGEAEWLSSEGKGRVVLLIKSGGKILDLVPIRKDVGRYQNYVFPMIRINVQAGESLTLRLAILGRLETPLEFGESKTVKP